jgi:peptide/nickel transport system permease protein
MRYVLRRLLSGLALVFALTLITFTLFRVVPAEPWRAILTERTLGGSHQPKPITQAEIDAANHKLGVDRPLIVQYGDFVWRIFRHGDFGKTFNGFDVKEGLKHDLPITWSIVGGGAVVLFLLAVPLGVLSALRANTWLDRVILFASIAGVALHPFIIGAGLKGLFGGKLGWLPENTYCPLRGTGFLPCTGESGMCVTEPPQPCGGFVDWSAHLALPWLTFAIIFLPLYMRMIRGAVIDVLPSTYVLTARAKGAGTLRVLRSHVLRNAMLPPLTMIGMEIGIALTVSIYIETIYNIHATGGSALAALGQVGDNFDLNTLAAITFTIAFTVIILNLLVDLAYAWLDPRIRAGRTPVLAPT